MYEGFAEVYDHMMGHIPYEEWFDRLKEYLVERGVTEGTICELGCGTGTMTELFADAGYDMIGVDNSEDMLAIAQGKNIENGKGILYVNQNMEELELPEAVDSIISICDSMNYLVREEDVMAVFSRVAKYLKPSGYFIFDMKTAFCYERVIGNQTWVEQDDEVSYIWENYYYPEEEINEYLLTIFKKQSDSELYEKIEEAHYQKVYSVERLKEMLEKCGLRLIDAFGENMQGEIKPDSERIYIVAGL